MTRPSSMRIACACLLVSLCSCPLASAFELITAEEAMRPNMKNIDNFRAGPMPEPVIKFHGARTTTPPFETTSPFNLVIELKPFAGAKINIQTLLVWYLKKPHVDLLPRIQSFIEESERTVLIKLRDAEAPIGMHHILFQVEDTNEQLVSKVLHFKVVNPR